MVNLWLIMVNHWNNNIFGWCFGTYEFDFSHSVGNVIIPTDELIEYFSEGLVGIPPKNTRKKSEDESPT